MAYTAVPTIVTGDVATAAWGNTHIKDNFAIVNDMIDLTNGLTANAMLSGNGTSEVLQLALSEGEVPFGNASGVPTAVQLLVSAASQLLRHEVGGIEADISSVAKGGLVAGTGTGTMGLQTVGSNGTYLSANSAQASGIEWVAGNSVFNVGNFTRDTSLASGNQAVTGVGFQPKACIFLMGLSGSSKASWGVDDGTNAGGVANWHLAVAEEFNPSTTASIWAAQTATDRYAGSITSLDADGFTIAWTKTGSPTGTITIIYLAMA